MSVKRSYREEPPCTAYLEMKETLFHLAIPIEQ